MSASDGMWMFQKAVWPWAKHKGVIIQEGVHGMNSGWSKKELNSPSVWDNTADN